MNTLRIFAVALLSVPLLAHAAGLGSLKVLSGLGQPLNAEVEIVSVQPGEDDSLSARLAPMEAFRQAGVEFNPVLLGLRFSIARRDGKPVLKLSTSQPVNEPFLELLVELQWTTGRLVREYTFLLDPPEYKGPQPITAAPAAAPAPAAQPAPTETRPSRIEERPLAQAPQAAPKTGRYEVKKGDTLGEIARRNTPPGVTYNQMLIALFRANRDSFIKDNINLVRTGRILSIPQAESAAAIDGDEARRIVSEHMSEFADYRRKLAAAVAAAPATAAPGERAVSGRITAPSEEKLPARKKDQLKLSKVDPNKPASSASRAAREDDVVARERAIKEAQSRVAELEKNVADLQKLIELKNQQLAELEKKSGLKPPPVAPVAKAPENPAAEAPRPAPAEAPKPAAETPKPAAQAPRPRPAPPPPPEPSLIDEFLDNPLALGGLGGVLALLLGYGAWAWRRKKAAQSDSSLLGASAGAASVFNAARAASEASGAPQAQASVSSVGGVETDEVDPIAEADVYMAYGRDAQAEEILREALQKDPGRTTVHAKLLEIFANRRDRPSFEKTALQLRTLTGAVGPEWEKAITLGRSIDPQNSLYGGTPEAALPRFATPGAAPSLDFDLDSVPGEAAPDVPLDAGEKPADAATSVDFDLGFDAAEEKSDFTPEGTLITGVKKSPEASGLDFDLGEAGETKSADAGLDFELPTVGGETPGEGAKKAADTDGGMDFKLDLDAGEAKDEAPKVPVAQPALDLSSISLDLDAPGTAGEPTTRTDPKWQEVATKLDLAKAYEEMGDKDGARELLNEVLKEGDAGQQSQARQMLSNLG